MAIPLDELMQKEKIRAEFPLTLSLRVVPIISQGSIIEPLTGQRLHNNPSSHPNNSLDYRNGNDNGKAACSNTGAGPLSTFQPKGQRK